MAQGEWKLIPEQVPKTETPQNRMYDLILTDFQLGLLSNKYPDRSVRVHIPGKGINTVRVSLNRGIKKLKLPYKVVTRKKQVYIQG